MIVTDKIEPQTELDFGSLAGFQRKQDDIVLLQHSSGTTGLQKGVALSHQAVFNQLDAYSRALELDDEDVVVSWLPLYHDMGLIAGFIMPILSGIPLVLMSPFDWVQGAVQVDAVRFEISRHADLASEFCLQLLRTEDP
ncbi:MAG: AMP-binding protein [Desulfobacterales bacterium]|nr:AMP-binding protein [Desulfobacterales bacterium]